MKPWEAAVRALLRARPRENGFERTALITGIVVFFYARLYHGDALLRLLPKGWLGFAGLVAILVVIAVGFRFEMHRRSIFWIAAGATILGTLSWWTTDNHIFLLAYWAIALGIALLREDPAAASIESARWLIGLVFLLATFWKLVSWSYLDTSMFHYLLLADTRMQSLPWLAGALTDAQLAENYARVIAIQDEALPGVTLNDHPTVAWLALGMTVATVVLEGAIAAVFLMPATKVPGWLRDGVLLLFLAGTYLMAPVLLFGTVLAAMGLAQSGPGAAKLYLLSSFYLYVVALFYIL